MSGHTVSGAIAVITLLGECKKQACNAKIAAEITGLTKQTAALYLKLLHEKGVVFIERWSRSSPRSMWIPHYRFGFRWDAKKPEIKPNALSCKEWRERRLLAV